MPRLLALDWTRHQARYVLANSNGKELTILDAGTIDLSALSDEEFGQPKALGDAIRDGLAPVKVGRANLLLGVSRAQAELLEFDVPAVPETELPGIVLNLAMRESPTVAEDSIVDFVAHAHGGDDLLKVNAAAITASDLKKLKQVCETAKLAPQRMVLRPFATASVLPADEPQRCLLINRIGDDADMTVVDGGRVVFSRTVRLPRQEDAAGPPKRLLQEIRRTMMVAPHGNGKTSVDAVVLLGTAAELADILPAVQAEFAADESNALDDHVAHIEVRGLDVFGEFAAAGATPEQSGSYAPLLGMLRTEAQGAAHPFDFLNPRKPPQPPDRKRTMVLVGGLLAVVAIVFGYLEYSDYQVIVEKNDKLASDIKKFKGTEKTIKKQANIAATIANWEAGGVNWLDEMLSFSERFPPPRDAMVLGMTLSGARVGTITFDGLARDPAVVTRMEFNLRDKTHDIQTARVQERVQENGYTWQFDTKITITPAKPDSDDKSKSDGKPSAKKKAGEVKDEQPAKADGKKPLAKKTKAVPADRDAAPAQQSAEADIPVAEKPAAAPQTGEVQ